MNSTPVSGLCLDPRRVSVLWLSSWRVGQVGPLGCVGGGVDAYEMEWRILDSYTQSSN